MSSGLIGEWFEENGTKYISRDEGCIHIVLNIDFCYFDLKIIGNKFQISRPTFVLQMLSAFFQVVREKKIKL